MGLLLIVLLSGPTHGDEPASAGAALEQAQALEAKAATLLRAGDAAQAETAAFGALEIRRKVQGKDSPEQAPTLLLLADARLKQVSPTWGVRRLTESRRIPHEVIPGLALYRRAAGMVEAARGAQDPFLGGIYLRIGYLREWMYDQPGAVREWQRGLGILLREGGATLAEALDAVEEAGSLAPDTWGDSLGSRRLARALRTGLERLLTRAEAQQGPESVEAARAAGYLGEALCGEAQHEERATHLLERAVRLLQQSPAVNSWGTRYHERFLSSLWVQCVQAGDLDRAVALGCGWVESVRKGHTITIAALRAAGASGPDAVDAAIRAACIHPGAWSVSVPILAERVALESIAERKRRAGESSAEVAAALASLGLVLTAAGRYDEACQAYGDCLAVRGRVARTAPVDVADALAARALSLCCVGRFAEARDDLLEALRVRAKDSDPLESFRLRVNLAMVADAAGDLRRAHEAADGALAVLRAGPALGAALLARNETLADLRTVLRRLGRVDDERSLSQGLDARLLPADPVVSHAARVRGDWQEAVRQERESLLAALRARGVAAESDRPPDRVFDLGAALLDAGRLDEGFACLLEATAQLEKGDFTLADTNRLKAGLLLDAHARMADAFAERGALERALPSAEVAFRLHEGFADYARKLEWMRLSDLPERLSFAQVVETFRTRVPPPESRAPQTYAALLAAMGSPEAGVRVLEDSLSTLAAQVSDRHPSVAFARAALAARRLDAKDAAGARSDADAALAALEALYGPAHPSLVPVLVTRADADLVEGKFAAARAGYERARGLAEKTLDPEHATIAMAWSGVALSLAREGRGKEALAPMRQALSRIEERVRANFPGSSLSERLDLIASVHWALTAWLEVSAAAGEPGYDEVVRLKALTGRAAYVEEALFRGASGAAREAVDEIRSTQRRLARLAYEAPERGFRRIPWRKEIAEVSARLETSTRALGKKYPALLQGVRLLTAGTREIQARLGSRQAVVDFLLAGGRYVAWVVAAGRTPSRIDLGDAEEIDAAVTRFREAVRDGRRLDDPALTAAARDAQERVWEPVVGHLGADVDTVYLVPDAELAVLPFAALPAGADGRMVGDRYLLAYLSAAQDILPPAETRTAGRRALVVGGVNYDFVVRPGAPVVTGLRRLSERVGGLRQFDSLPASLTEAQTLETLLRRAKGWDVVVLSDDRVREKTVREAAAGAGIVHLATHGFVRPGLSGTLRVPAGDVYALRPGLERHALTFDPMLLSGLALSGANARTQEDEDDGILTAMEALEIDLGGTDLVFLSACDSARGVAHAGEGVCGLVRGFRVAGARQVVASLWPIADEAAAALVRRFYERWTSEDRPVAADVLRRAAADLRKESRFDAPVHFAAFVAYGVPR